MASLIGAAAAAPPGLERLELRGCALGDEGRRALRHALAAGAWPRLEVLSLCGADDRVLAALAAAAHLASLQTLELADCRGSNGGGGGGGPLRQLSAAAWAPRLAVLRLSGAYLRPGADGAPPAVEARDLAPFERLSELSFSGCGVCDAGARELAAARLPALRRLALRRCCLLFAAADSLAAAPWADQLERLDLSGNQIVNSAVAALAAAPLPRLTHLDLTEVSPGGAALESFAAAPWLPRLERLAVSGDPDLVSVICAAPMPALRELRIEGLRAGGGRALGAAPWLGALRRLAFAGGLAPGAAEALRGASAAFARLEDEGRVLLGGRGACTARVGVARGLIGGKHRGADFRHRWSLNVVRVLHCIISFVFCVLWIPVASPQQQHRWSVRPAGERCTQRLRGNANQGGATPHRASPCQLLPRAPRAGLATRSSSGAAGTAPDGGSMIAFEEHDSTRARASQWRRAYRASPAAAAAQLGGGAAGAAPRHNASGVDDAVLHVSTSPAVYSSINARQAGGKRRVPPPYDTRPCTADAAAAVLVAAEAAVAAATGAPVPSDDSQRLSLQDFYWCSRGYRDCDTGLSVRDAVESLVKRSSSLVTARCLPYTAVPRDYKTEQELCKDERRCSDVPQVASNGGFGYKSISTVWQAQRHIRDWGAVVTGPHVAIYSDLRAFLRNASNAGKVYTPSPDAKVVDLVGYGSCNVLFKGPWGTFPGDTFGARPGDFLGRVALRLGADLRALVADNAFQITDPRAPIAGKRIVVCDARPSWAALQGARAAPRTAQGAHVDPDISEVLSRYDNSSKLGQSYTGGGAGGGGDGGGSSGRYGSVSGAAAGDVHANLQRVFSEGGRWPRNGSRPSNGSSNSLGDGSNGGGRGGGDYGR
ncbi:MAG: hypothetical protein J3K34DRAFT_481445 [Monoraphidium minutum]|nr:MAG: hypothetical protein J3K34DRAFT_481445 [Monoraphidium minutum]